MQVISNYQEEVIINPSWAALGHHTSSFYYLYFLSLLYFTIFTIFYSSSLLNDYLTLSNEVTPSLIILHHERFSKDSKNPFGSLEQWISYFQEFLVSLVGYIHLSGGQFPDQLFSGPFDEAHHSFDFCQPLTEFQHRLHKNIPRNSFIRASLKNAFTFGGKQEVSIVKNFKSPHIQRYFKIFMEKLELKDKLSCYLCVTVG